MKVFLFWPATLEMKGSRKDSSMKLYREWNEVLAQEGMTVLNQAGDFLLPPERMFDSLDHPDAKGRADVTLVLVEELRHALSPSAATNPNEIIFNAAGAAD